MSEFQKALNAITVQAIQELQKDLERSLFEDSTTLFRWISNREPIPKDEEYWRQQNQKVIDTALVKEFSKKFDALRESYRGINLSFDECGVYASVGTSPSIIIADYYD